jgi:hypothetical protein
MLPSGSSRSIMMFSPTAFARNWYGLGPSHRLGRGRWRLVAQLALALELASLVVLPTSANAQPSFGPGDPSMGGGFGGQQRPGRQPARRRRQPGTGNADRSGDKKKKDDEPEHHAASGADDPVVPPGGEPSLPDDPLAVPKNAEDVIGTDWERAEHSSHSAVGGMRRHFYGLYFSERDQEGYRFQSTFPPLWFQRTQPSASDPLKLDRASLWALYYQRRSAERADDIVFPFFWNLRDQETRTTVIGPWAQQRGPNKTLDWLAPLFFRGTSAERNYTLIPPLLTYVSHRPEGGFEWLGPAYCSWRGAQGCDSSHSERIDEGLAPVYFYGKDRDTEYRFVPPLLHYHKRDIRDGSSMDVWGPVYRAHQTDEDSLWVLPFYYSSWAEKAHSWTLFPLFHYSEKGESTLLATPLFLNATEPDGGGTFVTWLYARHRGATELDMYSPLVWLYRDEAIGLSKQFYLPFYYRGTGPREDGRAYFPFYARFERQGLRTSRWFTPLLNVRTDVRGWAANLHPLLYLGRSGHETHTVVAPFFWDFAGPKNRSTVAFPLFWRFSTPDTTNQLIGNVYYTEKKVTEGTDWEVHVFPFFSYGEAPDGHFWNLLYGLAGYTRHGSRTEARTLWIPIQLSE